MEVSDCIIWDLGGNSLAWYLKGAEQLRGYRAADLRHCFRLCQKQVFSFYGSNMKLIKNNYDDFDDDDIDENDDDDDKN